MQEDMARDAARQMRQRLRAKDVILVSNEDQFDLEVLALIKEVKDQCAQDVEVLHKALNDVLSLVVQDHGWDYHCVDAGLAALARNRDRLPITVPLAEKIDNARK